MNAIVASLSNVFHASAMSAPVAAALKAFVLLLVAAIAAGLLKNASASIRHRIWCAAFSGVVLLPVLSIALPHWDVAVLPAKGRSQRPIPKSAVAPAKLQPDAIVRDKSREARTDLPDTATENLGDAQLMAGARRATDEPLVMAGPTIPDPQRKSAPADGHAWIWPAKTWLVFGWAVGATILLVPLLVGTATIRLLFANCRALRNGAWNDLLPELCEKLRLKRHVHLLETAEAIIPVTWGVFRPVVLVPKDSQHWANDRRRYVLLHELAHIKRLDVPFQIIARLVCGLNWFNPLAWYALHRLRIERELACDDCVVSAGAKVSDYAAQLVELAREYRPLRLGMGVSISRTSNLESRVASLLDRARSHGPLSNRLAILLTVAAAVLVTATAIFRPVEIALGSEQPTEIAIENTAVRVIETASRASPIASATVLPAGGDVDYDPIAEAGKLLARMNVKPGDSPQMGRSGYRNNVSPANEGIPTDWDVASGKNIKWTAKLGSQTYASPVIANGKVFVGTNNANGYIKRYPAKVDLGCLLCFDETTGKFLWQHSNEKLPQGRVVDWEQLGICSSPYVEGDRLWYVTNRDEITCLDTEGFLDDENDGPFKEEPNQNKDETDIVWKLDMMGKLGASPRNACSCSVTALGDVLFVSTSNGVDEAHKVNAQPNAPSFVALNKKTGEVLWTDKSPGGNIMHGQWSSPACGVLGGVEQVLFAGGDGWLYSFDPQGDNGKSKLLWKFDCNPKTSVFMLERATRNPIIASPVIYDGLVYVGVGEDPEHGEGNAHLWCIDPTKRGDVSPTIVYNKKDPQTPIPYKRLQALNEKAGDFERDNINSAIVWHYVGNNPKKFEETMHRTISNTAIKNGLLFISDESGLFHCLDAKTGKAHWTHDLLCSSWSTPLIVGNLVYVADLDGDITVFRVSKQKELVAEQNMGIPVYTTPIAANGVLYIATFNKLIAIQKGATAKTAADK